MFFAILVAFAVSARATGANCPCPCGALQESIKTKFAASTCVSDSLSKSIWPTTPRFDGKREKVKLELQTWDSQHLSTMIFSIFARDVLNYDVEFVCTSSGNNGPARIENGVSDAIIEYWWGNYAGQNKKYVGQVLPVLDMGDLGYTGQSGVYQMSNTSEIFDRDLNITNLRYKNLVIDLAFDWHVLLVKEVIDLYANANDTDIISDLTEIYRFTPEHCNEWRADGVGNNCVDIKAEIQTYDQGYLHQTIVNLGLNATVSYWGLSGLQTYISRKNSRQELLLFKYFVPEAFMAANAAYVKRMDLPTTTSQCASNNTNALSGYGSVNCDFPKTELKKLSTRRIVTNDRQNAYYGYSNLIRELVISSNDINTLLAEFLSASSPSAFDIACNWIQNNTDSWEDWIEEIQCPEGKTLLEDGTCSLDQGSSSDSGKDNTIYFYIVLGIIPPLALAFYCVIKNRGVDFAEILVSMLTESTKVLMFMLLQIIDYATDAMAFVAVLRNSELRNYIYPYWVFICLGGLTSMVEVIVGCITLYSLLFKKKSRLNTVVGTGLSHLKGELLALEKGGVISFENQAELDYTLEKARNGIIYCFAGILNALVEVLPFCIMNMLILIELNEVNLIILISLLVNCVALGAVTYRFKELESYVEINSTLLKMTLKCLVSKEDNEKKSTTELRERNTLNLQRQGTSSLMRSRLSGLNYTNSKLLREIKSKDSAHTLRAMSPKISSSKIRNMSPSRSGVKVTSPSMGSCRAPVPTSPRRPNRKAPPPALTASVLEMQNSKNNRTSLNHLGSSESAGPKRD